jgi:hypothetical protein
MSSGYNPCLRSTTVVLGNQLLFSDPRRYLNILDPTDPNHCFQLIAGPRGGVTRTLHGPLDVLANTLVAANRQAAAFSLRPTK